MKKEEFEKKKSELFQSVLDGKVLPLIDFRLVKEKITIADSEKLLEIISELSKLVLTGEIQSQIDLIFMEEKKDESQTVD